MGSLDWWSGFFIGAGAGIMLTSFIREIAKKLKGRRHDD
jgi:hypothetical protein